MPLAALLSSLALLASSPSAMILAQADAAPAPAASSSEAVPTTNVNPNIQASAEALAAGEDPFPAGAPTDDYGFMGWCYGALAGHLDLYDKVMPEVQRIETQFPDPETPTDKVMAGYTDQHKAGQKILDDFGKALSVLEAEKKTGGSSRAKAVGKGRDFWKGSDTADARQLAQLWMSWGLPGRCDATAARLAPTAAAQ